MDLFTYLMAKNGHNTSIHEDLFSYLLGKSQGGGGEIKTATGITINIPDAKKLVSFMMTKESTQDGTPTPDNPVEVKTVKGYRNYLKNEATSDSLNGVDFTINDDKSILINGTASASTSFNLTTTMSLKKGTYTLFLNKNKEMSSGNYYVDIRITGTSTSIMDGSLNFSNNYKTFTINEDYDNLRPFVYIGNGKVVDNLLIKPIIVEGTTNMPYIPYGNNYVNVAVSDGTNTNNYPIPLNNNEIVGKGTDLDKYIVDKKGHCYLNKVFDKIDSYAGETITTPYWSTTGGLDTGATIYYVRETPQLIDLNTTVDLSLFEGTNNISNSEGGYMTIKYVSENEEA